MISLTAKQVSQFWDAEVILRGDGKTLQNIVQKLKLYRNLDSDLKQINPDDIKPALDALSKR
jgi:hypothetical protein